MFFGHDGFGLSFRVVALCLTVFLCLPSHSYADGKKVGGVLLCVLGAAYVGIGIIASQDKENPSGPKYAPRFCAMGALIIIYGVVLLRESESARRADGGVPGMSGPEQEPDLQLACRTPARRINWTSTEPHATRDDLPTGARVALGVAPVRGGVLAGVQVRF